MFLTAFSLLALLIPFYCTDTINPILMGLCLIIPDPQHETPLLLVTREKKNLSKTYLLNIPTAFSEHWGVIPNPNPSDLKITLDFKHTSNTSPASLQV